MYECFVGVEATTDGCNLPKNGLEKERTMVTLELEREKERVAGERSRMEEMSRQQRENEVKERLKREKVCGFSSVVQSATLKSHVFLDVFNFVQEERAMKKNERMLEEKSESVEMKAHELKELEEQLRMEKGEIERERNELKAERRKIAALNESVNEGSRELLHKYKVVAGFGRFWRVVAGCGMLWRVVVNVGRLWHVVASCGRLWHVVASCGKCWQVVAGCGKFWQIVVSCGEFWRVLAGCGKLWHVVACCGSRFALLNIQAATFNDWCNSWQELQRHKSSVQATSREVVRQREEAFSRNSLLETATARLNAKIAKLSDVGACSSKAFREAMGEEISAIFMFFISLD